MDRMTQRDFARMFGLSSVQVSNLVRDGLLDRDPKGGVNFTGPNTKRYIESLADVSENTGSLDDIKKSKEIEKLTEEIKKRKLDYAEKSGELIDREKVATSLFHYLDALNTNMLDLPDLMIEQIVENVKAGIPKKDVVEFMKDQISNEIKSTKAQIIDRLERI